MAIAVSEIERRLKSDFEGKGRPEQDFRDRTNWALFAAEKDTRL
jgi:hypothetical protein